jgi:hypothetical protein
MSTENLRTITSLGSEAPRDSSVDTTLDLAAGLRRTELGVMVV